MKEKKQKKIKKKKKQPLPIWSGVQTNKQPSEASLFMNVAIRIALLCAATAGVGLLLIQLYQIPIDSGAVIIWTVFAALLFNTAFIFLKFRYAFPVIIIGAFLYIRTNLDEALFNLGCFADYMLVYVDGGMLATAGYAVRDSHSVLYSMSIAFREGLQSGVIMFMIVLALIFSMSARGKFIGSILITCVIITIPAIASQKASYVPAMTVLAVSMFGLYSIWASQEQGYLRNNKPRKQKKGPFIPKIHRHAVNGAAAAFLALIASIIVGKVMPQEKTPEIIQFFSDASDRIVEFAERVGQNFEGNWAVRIPEHDTGGYMPSGNIDASSSMSINNPTIGRRAVLNVTLEDASVPVYLRHGIGALYDADKGRWNVENSKGDILKSFPVNFYPEHQYLIFRQIAEAQGYDPDRFMGHQTIEIEYLVRSSHVMFPASPYMPDYKTDTRFNWTHDTILSKRGSKNPVTYIWDVLYPRIYNSTSIVRTPFDTIESVDLSELSGDSLTDHARVEFNTSDGGILTGALRIFVEDYGLTAAEYLRLMDEYEQAVYETYTTTVASESANMQRLLEDIVFSHMPGSIMYSGDGEFITVTFMGEELTAQIVSDDMRLDIFTNDSVPVTTKASLIEEYFKTQYGYSLIVDNNSGSNTMLGNFLFETREAHCAFYATAMTLAMRELGVPARFVTGYVAGGRGGSSGRYTQTIIERDIHAWVEVYVSGVGWLPYDPTPPIYDWMFIEAEREAGTETRAATTPRTTRETTPTLPRDTTNRPETTPRETTEPTVTTPPDNTEIKENILTTLLPLQLILYALIILFPSGIVFATFMFIRSVKRAEKKRISMCLTLSETNDRNAAREAYKFILSLLQLEKLTASPGETPVKFAARADGAITGVNLSAMINIARKLEFSREELTAEEFAELSAAADGLYRHVVLAQKSFKRFMRKAVVFKVIK